jgi:translin
MDKITGNLDEIIEKIRQDFTRRDAAREKVLPLCRDAIRCCSQSIRAVHRQEFDQAVGLLKSARDLLTEAEQAAGAYHELVHAGYVRDAQKEFAEGCIVLALVTGEKMPGPAELAIGAAAYLNGMGEAAGELRRYLLDGLRGGDLSRGEAILTAMDDIYSALVTMDFPDAITGGLRRTTDMVRGVLERTRSDLTLAIRQQALENRLEKFEKDN